MITRRAFKVKWKTFFIIFKRAFGYQKLSQTWECAFNAVEHHFLNSVKFFWVVLSLLEFIFRTSHREGEFPRGSLMNTARIYLHIIKTDVKYEQKPVFTVKMLISEQIAFAAVLYFKKVFVFCKLINKSLLEWFLLIMCK